MKQIGHIVSVVTLHRIHHGKGVIRNNMRTTRKTVTFQKRPIAKTGDVIRKIRNMIGMVTPSTQTQMANKCGVPNNMIVLIPYINS